MTNLNPVTYAWTHVSCTGGDYWICISKFEKIICI